MYPENVGNSRPTGPVEVETSTGDEAILTVVPLSHPWRRVCVLLVSAGLVIAVYAVLSTSAFQWPVVWEYLFHSLILQGLWVTIWLTVVVMVLAIIIGTIVALMRVSRSPFLNLVAVGFIWLFRGPPILVQLILWYNLSLVFENISLTLPIVGTVFSVPTNEIMTPIAAAIIALSLHEAGYMAEIIRAGLKAIAVGQTEAALSLGMPPSLLTRRIILPQAMRIVIPPTGNETINLLKTTSLVSIIAVGDVLYSAQTIYSRTFETIPLLLVATVWYLVIVTAMTAGQFRLERYYSKNLRSNDVPGVFKSIWGTVLRTRGGESHNG